MSIIRGNKTENMTVNICIWESCWWVMGETISIHIRCPELMHYLKDSWSLKNWHMMCWSKIWLQLEDKYMESKCWRSNELSLSILFPLVDDPLFCSVWMALIPNTEPYTYSGGRAWRLDRSTRSQDLMFSEVSATLKRWAVKSNWPVFPTTGVWGVVV